MNISYNWLKSYLSVQQSPEELAKILTDCGLEVESIETFESVKGGLAGLIVGEVLETQKHPNADRLTVCKVNLGNGIVSQIVCGAPNVAAGQKVVVATPGTLIYPVDGEPFEINKSKIRGEASEGMICAEDEIGLGGSHEGVIVLENSAIPGTPAVAYFDVESDFTLSIGLTPNRPDAASHIGVARDIAAVVNTVALDTNGDTIHVLWPDVSGFKAPSTAPVISVIVEDDSCIRYSGVHIKNVKVSESPEWLKNRLKAIGLKPINNVVDVTNFVLYEMGQPLHAFDANSIHENKIIVKKLPAGTKFKTLDNIERTLNGNELMICDPVGGLCIAGVFGGFGSGVTNTTTAVFLESATFDPVSVRKTSKAHGLKTDASFRFERGTDPEITITALKRAALLISELTGGEISSDVVDIYPSPVKHFAVPFNVQNFNRLTGVSLSKNHIEKILSWLDIKIELVDGDSLQLLVPPYRVDVRREVDVIEELLRIYGYDRIPLPHKMNTSLPPAYMVPLEKIKRDMSSYLVANGFTEVMNNSLTRSSALESIGDTDIQPAKIRNPLSQDLDILRTGMLVPMLDTLLYNRNRRTNDLRIFEVGKTYQKSDVGFKEESHLAILISGDRNPQYWEKQNQTYNIFYLKSIIQDIFNSAKIRTDNYSWEVISDNILSQGLSLISGKKELAKIGQISSKTLKHFDLDGLVLYADIRLDYATKSLRTTNLKISEPPRFPEVRRDLSMLLDKAVSYQSLENVAYDTEKKLLKKVNLFDIYEGDKLESGKKSYALSFILRDDEKTLTDKDIDKVMQRLMENFEKKLGAVIRKT